jgi:hypothetical protein
MDLEVELVEVLGLLLVEHHQQLCLLSDCFYGTNLNNIFGYLILFMYFNRH